MARGSSKLPRGINANSNGTYRARVTYEGRQYTIGTYMAVSYAKAALDVARGQMARGTFVPPAVRLERRKRAEAEAKARLLTVKDWSERWLDDLKKRGRTANTIVTTRSVLTAHILPMLGDMQLVDVTQDHIDGVTSGKTPTVTRNVLRTLSAMYNAAIRAEAGGVTRSPITAKAPQVRRSASSERMLSLEQVRAIAEAMPEDLQAAVWLAATCGLRLGEILGLQRHDLELDDPDKAVLHVRRQWMTKASPAAYGPPKDGSARSIAVPDAIVPILVTQLARYVGPDDDAPVFPSVSSKKKPVPQTSFNTAWSIAREPVKPGYHFHYLRHVALTLYSRQGATQRDTMQRGGHSDPKVAQIYQETDENRDRELTNKLNESIKDAVGTPKIRKAE